MDISDSVSASDQVAMTNNRQGQMKARTDQHGVVRSLLYDKLGRLSDDCATNLGGSGVGSGSIVNEVTMEYNEFTQLTKESQSHSGAVSSSPNVQYACADGSVNTIRPTSLTYPNSRVISCDYGSAYDPYGICLPPHGLKTRLF